MVNALGNKTKDINKAVAEVEGGEYNYRYNPTNPKDNYILSEQLGIANMAKQADRFKNNDRISYNTRTNLLNKSVKLNEVLKAQQEQSQMQMALGGELKNVNPFDKQPPKQKDSDFRKSYQSTPMNVAKMFDPTGISSYPDVAYSIDDYNKGKGSKSDIALNVLGALPIVGKATGLIRLAKGTSKTKKGLDIITKLGDLAGDIERFPLKTMKDLTSNATKPIAKMVNKSSTNLLDFNDVIRNKIVPPLSNNISKKVVTKADMLNAGTSLLNIGNLGSDINSASKKQLGRMLKKYGDGGFSDNGPIDDNIQNYYKNTTTRDVVSTPGNELTNVPIQPTAPLLSGSQKFNLPTKVQSVNPKVNNLDVSKEMQQAQVAGDNPVKQKKNNFKGALSAVAGAVSALGPIGQGVGTAMQLAPYAIDLGKAMFDKTSVQDLQTQGSAMRLPNTTYAKNGGKLNVKPLPKFDDGTNINKDRNPFDKIEKKEGTVSSGKVNMLNPFYRRTEQTSTPSTKITGTIPLGKVDMTNPFNRNDSSFTEGTVSSGRVEGNPFDTRLNPTTTTGTMTNRRLEVNPFVADNPLFNKLPIPPIIDMDNPFNRNRDLIDPFNLNKDKKKSTPVKEDTPVITPDDKTNTKKNKGNSGKGKSTPVVNDNPTAAEIEEAKKTRAKFNENPLTTLNTIPLPTTIKSNKPGVNDLTTLNIKNETNMLRRAGLNVKPQPSESESSKLFKAGQNKQKLSEALMYGMAALPSEQIKTITPDYGRGDDAMSRMGLSTEPIRQEMMQGANKALELSRSQVGTAGQLQSRGQSIMSNLSSQLSQSQIQQQQYLNQLRGALAQREDTKSNVLAQSELTAREAKSAERAAKLDQLNNAISQTSAIGAGTMEQASKMSTIENENERFKRNQDFIRELANQGVAFEVDENGKIVFNNKVGSSNIKQADLSNPNKSVVKDDSVVQVTPKEHVVKQGEGLNAIAAQYKIPVDKLLKLNNLKIGDTIHPNQKLKIE
jgi:LysM repeat protein